MKRFLSITSLLLCVFANAQISQLDTANIYKERFDTLSAASAVSSAQGNYLSKFKDVRTEVISAAGLCKMACCNLAESFENSASVTVGYSDAVTGARQIRLLGLSGTYTQMLDENRPVMRGLASPFGLNYVPGQWLSSIQIAKGAPSVINGVESITGQINMEHRKPTDEIPLFVNAAIMSDTKADLNVASSLQLDQEGKWSTVLLGHVSGNVMGHDMNKDGFLDEPHQLLVNFANRWLYFGSDGTQVRFGIKYLRDQRNGGMVNPNSGWRNLSAYNRDEYTSTTDPKDNAYLASHWGSQIVNQNFNAYLKVGVPLNEDNSQNIALVSDFNDYVMNSGFGKTIYDASQISGFANLLYQNQMWDSHHFTFGASTTYDNFNQYLRRVIPVGLNYDGMVKDNLWNVGVFGEYTFKYEEKLSVIGGLRADWYNNGVGFKASPRLTVRYTPVEQLVVRFNGGRGLRYANPIADNIGVMSTGKLFYSGGQLYDGVTRPLYMAHSMEDAWVVGGNATWYLPFGVGHNKTYLSFDYFRTQFADQVIVDYEQFSPRNVQEASTVNFYTLKSLGKTAQSFTDTYQVDFSVEPVERFTITATFRYTNAKVTMANRGLVERPMTSRYKGVLNLQYATNLNKWIFDVTCSVNGPCKVYDFMKGQGQINDKGYSPVYPLLYAQVTHRMKGWDIYFGGENLTNFTQKTAILSGRDSEGNPSAWNQNFDASCIWGPLMGIKAYVGVRVTLWKKE